MKKLLAINGSPRKNGCSPRVIKKVAETVKGYGYETETVEVCNLDINGCKACMSCKKTGECAQKDDMTPLYAKIREADALMLASPVYFAAETGQLKCFMDRLYAMIGLEDGKMVPDLGKPKKGTVFIPCGAPNGAMLYCNILSRLTATLRSLGIEDVSGVVVPSANPETVCDSDYVAEYLESIEFQMENE